MQQGTVILEVSDATFEKQQKDNFRTADVERMAPGSFGQEHAHELTVSHVIIMPYLLRQ